MRLLNPIAIAPCIKEICIGNVSVDVVSIFGKTEVAK